MFNLNNKKINQRLKNLLFPMVIAIGLIGLSFGITVFLVFGNDSKYEADTQTTPVKVKEVVSVDAKKSTTKETIKQMSVTNPVPESPTQLEQTSQPEQKEPAVQPVIEDTDLVTYTIASGDSLSGISEKFGTTMPSIMQQNNIENAQDIVAGQVLHFSKSYVVKEESTPPVVTKVEKVETDAVPQEQSLPAVSVDNGNKVVAGGLSKEERTYVLTQLQSRTGVPASQWDYIISRESGWMLNIKNALGYYGLFQLAPGYRGYDGGLAEQIEGAIYLFNHGGMAHWAL